MKLRDRLALLLQVIGTLVAAYMTYQHFTQNSSMACSAGGVVDCVSVTTSRYAYLFGVPVALAGLVWFVATWGVWLWARHSGRTAQLVQLVWLGVGLAFVFYLVWVELVPLGKICSWCTVVHVVTLLLFLVKLYEVVLDE